MTSIAVLGPGGVGGLLAAALARAGEDVVVIAREPTAELIARGGIEVRSVRLGDFVAHPRATARLRHRVDALFLATKATGLQAALDRIEAPPELVIPLLNGLDHMASLRDRFDHVVAGTIRVESDRPEPARIVQSSPFLRVDLATDDPVLAPALKRLGDMLQRAGVPARVEGNEAQVLWSKLVRLNALACTTSATGRPVGFIRADPQWRAALKGCIEEAAAVARAEGAEIDPAQGLAELDEAHAALGSSMQRDIAAGREPELDAIAGAVLRAGDRHGLKCETIARLSAQIAQHAGVPAPSHS